MKKINARISLVTVLFLQSGCLHGRPYGNIPDFRSVFSRFQKGHLYQTQSENSGSAHLRLCHRSFAATSYLLLLPAEKHVGKGTGQCTGLLSGYIVLSGDFFPRVRFLQQSPHYSWDSVGFGKNETHRYCYVYPLQRPVSRHVGSYHIHPLQTF